MVFNSFNFIFILVPLTLIIFFVLGYFGQNTLAKMSLIASSIVFYALNAEILAYVLVFSVTVNYAAILFMKEREIMSRRLIMRVTVVLNLLCLGYYKYTNFFIDNLNQVIGTGFSFHEILLPLGLSFITFQQIMFVIDYFEGLIEEVSLVDYLSYVLFFPKLISGPIMQYNFFVDQFSHKEFFKLNQRNLYFGMLLFSIGLAKKVGVADNLVVWVDAAFSAEGQLNFWEAWLAALAFSLQVYFDFSGYTDMALGVALLFNIGLPLNFNSPFKATSIIEFWQRWHMTLTQFLTTYVFTPVIRAGGSVNFGWVAFATIFTMLVSGIWHGASWVFILFGLCHGIALVANRFWRMKKWPMHPIIGWIFTILLVVFVNVLFRAENLSSAIDIYSAMVGLSGFGVPAENALSSIHSIFSLVDIGPAIGQPGALVLVLILLGVCIFLPNSFQILSIFERRPIVRVPGYLFLMYIFILVAKWDNQQYVYFTF